MVAVVLVAVSVGVTDAEVDVLEDGLDGDDDGLVLDEAAVTSTVATVAF